jgi:hypothetical protein
MFSEAAELVTHVLGLICYVSVRPFTALAVAVLLRVEAGHLQAAASAADHPSIGTT